MATSSPSDLVRSPEHHTQYIKAVALRRFKNEYSRGRDYRRKYEKEFCAALQLSDAEMGYSLIELLYQVRRCCLGLVRL